MMMMIMENYKLITIQRWWYLYYLNPLLLDLMLHAEKTLKAIIFKKNRIKICIKQETKIITL